MALDGLVLHALTSELQSCIGGRINKIHQPTEHDIVMQLRAQGSNKKLLLSANPTYPRAHFTDQQFINPQEAPMFCMLLRKHCEGGIIESVEQVELERIIRISLKQRDELGDISTKCLIVELMGRHSNIILIDPASGIIIDGIHHVTPAISSYRVIMPGFSYTEPPEQHKTNPLSTDEAVFHKLWTESRKHNFKRDKSTENPPLSLQKWLIGTFSGLSPLACKEIVFRCGYETDQPAENADENRVLSAFFSLLDPIRKQQYEPVIAEDSQSGKLVFAVYQIRHLKGETKKFGSISGCLETYYGDKAERDTVKQRTADLIKFLQNEKQKNKKKLDKLAATLEEAKEADQFRIQGELLTAALHQIQKGEAEAEVINYYDEKQRPVKIKLDPQLTPSENAQRYFKKYTKAKNSSSVVTKQMEQAKDEINYLETLLQQLESASLRDIEEIREELTEQGYLRGRRMKEKKKKKPGHPSVACYTSSDGIPIYVGKNNKQNEYVTNRLAKASDIWLHTKDIPGSHVVIRSSEVPQTTLYEAAELAAYFSQAKHSSQVPVDYTLIKHVRKPNGAKPGFVIYERQKTLFVTPDEDKLKQLPQVYK
jgi:predicted ribosome quality control (RQC) complex YloA/Tae2 family protein